MESLIEEIQNLIQGAGITDEDVRDWVRINFSDFSDVEAPEILEDGGALDSLDFVNRGLREIDAQDGRQFLDQLSAEVQPLTLAGYLWVAIEIALKKDSNLQQMRSGALACSIYMKISTLDLANTHRFYNTFIVQKVICLWRDVFRVIAYGVRSPEEMKEVQTKKKTGKKVRKGDDDDWPVHPALPRDEMLKLLKTSTSDLFIYLNRIALADQNEMAILCANFVSDIARIDFTEKEIKTKAVDRLEDFEALQYFCERSIALSHLLGHGRHSADHSLLYERIVQPRLLLLDWNNMAFGGTASMPMAIVNYGELYLKLIEDRLATADNEEIEIIYELIYAMTLKCPDRAEYRSRLPRTIVALLKMLPAEKYYIYRFVLWDLFVHNKSIPIVIELCTLLINEFDWSLPDAYFEAYENSLKEKTSASSPTKQVKEEVLDETELEEETNQKNKKKKRKESDVLHNTIVEESAHLAAKTKKNNGPAYFPKGNAVLYRILVGAIIHTSAVARARALCLIAGLLEDKNKTALLKDAAYDLHFAFFYTDDVVFDEGARPSVNPAAKETLLPIFAMCAKDEKAQVRKGAALCLGIYLLYTGDTDFASGVEIFKSLCLDESHVVRRQSADSITDLLNSLEMDSDRWHTIADTWIHNVFPLIGDSDSHVAEIVAKLLLELVLKPLIEASEGQVQVKGLAAQILKRIYPGSTSRSEFIRALREQATHKHLDPSIIEMVQKQIENNTNGVNISDFWALLDCLVMVFPTRLDAGFICKQWFAYTLKPRPLANWIPTPTLPYGKTTSILLSIIRAAKDKFSKADKVAICKNLQMHLLGYTVPVDFISEVWLTLATLFGHKMDQYAENENEELRTFAAKIYRFAQNTIKNLWKVSNFEEKLEFLTYPVEEQAETFLIRMIVGTGYAVQYNLDLIYLLDQDVIADIREEPLLISFLLKMTTDCISDLRFGLKENRKKLKMNNGPHPFGLPGKRNGRWTPDSDWITQRLNYSDIIINLPARNFSEKIRAAAATSVGAHCIYDGLLMREFLPELMKELQASTCPAVRANLLVPCCDMVKRFAAADTQGLPDALAMLLVDPHPLIRQQCLQMMTHLLKEQFVKWEGLVMHLYTILCIDDNLETASFAQNALQNALLPVLNDMLYTNFMEFVLFYNNAPFVWDKDTGLKSAARKRVRVDGYGSDSTRFIWRQTILRFLLSTFTDFERFGTMVRMCEDVLLKIVKGVFEITDYCMSNLVNDCLELLGCEEMDFLYTPGKKTTADGEELPVEEEPTDAVQDKVTEALMQAYRTGLQQRILPVLFQLLLMCEQKRLGAFARKTLFTIELLCKDHVEYVEDMMRALCPGRVNQIISDMKDPNGLVQRELALRVRDRERDCETDMQLMLANAQTENIHSSRTPRVLRTPRINRASIVHNALVEERVNETLAGGNDAALQNQHQQMLGTPTRNGQPPNMGPDGLRSASRGDTLRFVVDALATTIEESTRKSRVTDARLMATNLADILEDNEDDHSMPVIVPRGRGSSIPPIATALEKQPKEEIMSESMEASTQVDTEPMDVDAGVAAENQPNNVSMEVEGAMQTAIIADLEPEAETSNNELVETAIAAPLDEPPASPEPIPGSSTKESGPVVSNRSKELEISNSSSILVVTPIRSREARTSSNPPRIPTYTVRTVPLKGGQDEESEKENKSARRSSKPTDEEAMREQTFNFEIDETVMEGRACSTPNQARHNMDLTFAGLDYSVIQKDPKKKHSS